MREWFLGDRHRAGVPSPRQCTICGDSKLRRSWNLLFRTYGAAERQEPFSICSLGSARIGSTKAPKDIELHWVVMTDRTQEFFCEEIGLCLRPATRWRLYKNYDKEYNKAKEISDISTFLRWYDTFCSFYDDIPKDMRLRRRLRVTRRQPASDILSLGPYEVFVMKKGKITASRSQDATMRQRNGLPTMVELRLN